MPTKVLFRPVVLLISLASLAACTGMQGPDAPQTATTNRTETVNTPPGSTGTVTNTETAGTENTGAIVQPIEAPVEPVQPPANPAVVALLDNAHINANAGRLPSATAALERALRIEPRNPVLWQELAALKLKKGDYVQAENCAARSNSWAGSNKLLQAKNWRIISEARSLRGDNPGSKAAMERAKALE